MIIARPIEAHEAVVFPDVTYRPYLLMYLVVSLLIVLFAPALFVDVWTGITVVALFGVFVLWPFTHR